MKIGIAADHGGFEIKQRLFRTLENLGHEAVDFGPQQLDPKDDYPDYGKPAALAVGKGTVDRSILICNNGIGMCMLANKVPGVRGALVYNKQSAAHTRKHHDSNVLCLGGQEFSAEELESFIQIWLTTEFEGGRHERRMGKILDLENAPST
ncbi:MAG: RpiB/LacA/LacB family sugar-phosphate isomerase [Verrucomicrobiota bacterium]